MVDYSGFGVQLDGRSFSSDTYRYGYQGSEKVDEVSGEGNHYTTYYRGLDPRVVRWWSIDPKTSSMPWQSPYISMDNNPIMFNDPMGDSIYVIIGKEYSDEKGMYVIYQKVTAEDLESERGKAFISKLKEVYSVDEGEKLLNNYLNSSNKDVYIDLKGFIPNIVNADGVTYNPKYDWVNEQGEATSDLVETIDVAYKEAFDSSFKYLKVNNPENANLFIVMKYNSSKKELSRQVADVFHEFVLNAKTWTQFSN